MTSFLEKIYTLFFNDTSDKIIDTFKGVESFMVESDYIKQKRQELINKDKQSDNPLLLVNNPKRKISLRKSTVLKKRKRRLASA